MLRFDEESLQSEAYRRYVAGSVTPVLGGNIRALFSGARWNEPVDPVSQRMTITYSFGDRSTSRNLSAYAAPFLPSMQAFTHEDRDVTRAILASIAEVANIRFVEVDESQGEVGQIRYAYSQHPNALGYAGYSFYPLPVDVGGDVFIGTAQMGPEWGYYRPGLIMHETMHALGLKHPFEGGETLPSDDDVIVNTTLSYSTIAGYTTGSISAYPVEPMPLDVMALQALYGAADANLGNTRYDLSDPAYHQGFRVIYDTSGEDTLDASRTGNPVLLDLRAGFGSDVGDAITAFARNSTGATLWDSTTYNQTLVIAGGVDIEGATGSSFDDFLLGNDLANTLNGGAGNDILAGGRGNDILIGGAGVDVVVYLGSKADFTLARSGSGWVVSNARGDQGTDTLRDVERIALADSTLALDFGIAGLPLARGATSAAEGNAALAARILGGLLNPQFVYNKTAFGIALGLIDAGTSERDVVATAIEAALGPAPSNEVFVTWVYRNVAGTLPSASELSYFVGLLNAGSHTQVTLGQLAVHTDLLAQQINLTGLSQTGVEYVPSLQ